MLDIPDLAVYSDLNAGVVRRSGIRRIRSALDKRWIGVHHRSCKIENTAHGHWVLECGGIQRDEGRSSMCKACGAAKGKLESLLEKAKAMRSGISM